MSVTRKNNSPKDKPKDKEGESWLGALIPDRIQELVDTPIPGAQWLRDLVDPANTSVMSDESWLEQVARDTYRGLIPQTPRDAALEAAIGMIAGPVIGKAGRAVSRKFNPPFDESRRVFNKDVSGGDLMNQIRSRDAMLGDWAEVPDFTTYQNPHMIDEILTEAGRPPIGHSQFGRPKWSDKDYADAKRVADSMGYGSPGLDNIGLPKRLLREVSYDDASRGIDSTIKKTTRPYERSALTDPVGRTERERIRQKADAFALRKDKEGTYWHPQTKASGLSAKHIESSPKMTGTDLPEYTEAGRFSSPTLRKSVTKGMDTLSTRPEHAGILEEFFNVMNKRITDEVLEETGEEILKGSEGEITEKALNSLLRRFGVRK